MSVAVQTSDPFSEIDREVRRLERLLNHKTMDVEILQKKLDIVRASEPMSQSSRWSGPGPVPHETVANGFLAQTRSHQRAAGPVGMEGVLQPQLLIQEE
jgi:hypothetical protein